MEAAENNYLRTAEVARMLHVSPKTVARWASLGMIGCVKTLGGHRRFSEAQIKELVEKLSLSPTVDVFEKL